MGSRIYKINSDLHVNGAISTNSLGIALDDHLEEKIIKILKKLQKENAPLYKTLMEIDIDDEA